MPNREKVIKELEERIKVAEECMGNPMFTPDALRTIVALLKEQEEEIEKLKEIIIKADSTLEIVKERLNELLYEDFRRV